MPKLINNQCKNSYQQKSMNCIKHHDFVDVEKHWDSLGKHFLMIYKVARANGKGIKTTSTLIPTSIKSIIKCDKNTNGISLSKNQAKSAYRLPNGRKGALGPWKGGAIWRRRVPKWNKQIKEQRLRETGDHTRLEAWRPGEFR